jgi:hypothetical protein
MQLATAATSIIHGKEPLIVLVIAVIIGISSAFFLYANDRFSLMYYGDSISHLVRAREFVDSINPGLFEQLGTAWLPLRPEGLDRVRARPYRRCRPRREPPGCHR